MTKWEYHCVASLKPQEHQAYDAYTEMLQDQMNNLGLEGWELVHIGEAGMMVFKRPKADV